MRRNHNIRSRAFTLTEILIVIGLIVLIIALAVPAFNFISGTRSVEAARNKVSAMLSRARNEAIGRKIPVGVFFYRDTTEDMTAMTVVTVGPGDMSGPLAYQAWTPRPGASAAPAGQFYRTAHADIPADRIYCLVRSGDPATPGTTTERYVPLAGVTPGGWTTPDENKWVVRIFDCKVDHDSTATASGASSTGPPPYEGNDYWEPVGATGVLALDTSIEYLPRGVNCQLVYDARGAAPNTTDKFVQTGCIVFDEFGRLLETDFTVTQISFLGTRLGLTADLRELRTPQRDPASAVGVMLFDHQQMIAQNGATLGDPTMLNLPLPVPGAYGTAGTGQEYDEEVWIEQNALHLLVDRYSGNLVKVE